ncbi:unnamed protein product, partial [Scytosiphon promiscuus]
GRGYVCHGLVDIYRRAPWPYRCWGWWFLVLLGGGVRVQGRGGKKRRARDYVQHNGESSPKDGDTPSAGRPPPDNFRLHRREYSVRGDTDAGGSGIAAGGHRSG